MVPRAPLRRRRSRRAWPPRVPLLRPPGRAPLPAPARCQVLRQVLAPPPPSTSRPCAGQIPGRPRRLHRRAESDPDREAPQAAARRRARHAAGLAQRAGLGPGVVPPPGAARPRCARGARGRGLGRGAAAEVGAGLGAGAARPRARGAGPAPGVGKAAPRGAPPGDGGKDVAEEGESMDLSYKDEGFVSMHESMEESTGSTTKQT
mmetsp:Transcript_42936/g.110672  ORF Transcript_42936/g.110672 Transcript_42936/m.110672 type:complete len:205 (+) Transcript_42936:286-900(+)